MNQHDFTQLIDRLKATGLPILPLEECYDTTNVISIRHDVDDNLCASFNFAKLEERLGIRSTYFVLDTAPYWNSLGNVMQLGRITNHGHYLGWHNNAIAAHRQGFDLRFCVQSPLAILRNFAPIIGTASHGDPLCHKEGFLNYYVFKGTNWNPKFPSVPMRTFDLEEFGLEYEAYHTGHTHYISESGGQWGAQTEEILKDFERCVSDGKSVKLQVLIHPQWWNVL